MVLKNHQPANSNENRKKRTLPKEAEPYKFKPGQSGNPSGRPKRDLSAEIARAIFEQNAEKLYEIFTKKLLKGNIKEFTGLAVRAYGEVPRQVEHTGRDGEPIKLVVEHIGNLPSNQAPAKTK